MEVPSGAGSNWLADGLDPKQRPIRFDQLGACSPGRGGKPYAFMHGAPMKRQPLEAEAALVAINTGESQSMRGDKSHGWQARRFTWESE